MVLCILLCLILLETMLLFNMNCINFVGSESVIYAKNYDLNMSNCILIKNIADSKNPIGSDAVYPIM